MTEQYPLFSVAIVSFNQDNYIFECIDSILSQDYPQVELIISDDSSENYDAKKIEKYIIENKSDNLVNYSIVTNEKRLGTTKNANKAFSLCNGLFLKLIAADDMLFDSKTLNHYADVFIRENANIVSGRCFVFDKFNQYTKQYPGVDFFGKMANSPSVDLLEEMIFTNNIHTPGVALRKSFFYEIGPFNEEYFLIEDWPLWLKICRLNIKIDIVKEPVVIYRMGGVSNSNSKNAHKYKKEVWSSYFSIYKKEVLPYKKMISTANKNKLYRVTKKLEYLYERDFLYDSFTKKQKIFHKIKGMCFSTINSLKKLAVFIWSQVSFRSIAIFLLISFVFLSVDIVAISLKFPRLITIFLNAGILFSFLSFIAFLIFFIMKKLKKLINFLGNQKS